METKKGGFVLPDLAKDNVAAKSRTDAGLSPDTSMEDAETKATQLLNNPRTLIQGAEVVLGRRVDASKDDPELLKLVGNPVLSGEEKFALLLLYKSFGSKK